MPRLEKDLASDEEVFLCSGHMINQCFGTAHNDPESLWLLTKHGFVPFEGEVDEKKTKEKTPDRTW